MVRTTVRIWLAAPVLVTQKATATEMTAMGTRRAIRARVRFVRRGALVDVMIDRHFEGFGGVCVSVRAKFDIRDTFKCCAAQNACRAVSSFSLLRCQT